MNLLRIFFNKFAMKKNKKQKQVIGTPSSLFPTTTSSSGVDVVEDHVLISGSNKEFYRVKVPY